MIFVRCQSYSYKAIFHASWSVSFVNCEDVPLGKCDLTCLYTSIDYNVLHMTMLQVPDGVLEVLATNCPGPDATLNCVVVRAATTIANRAEAETEAHINVAEKDSVVTGM